MKLIFTEAELIVLKRIFGKSAESASLAMEKIFSSKPKKCDFNLEFSSGKKQLSFSDSKDKMVATLLGFEGEVSGKIVMAFPERDLNSKIFNTLFSGIGGQSKELVESAIGEVANIVVGAFFSALSDYCQINILETTPEIIYDYWDSILSDVSKEVGEEEILIVNIHFNLSPDFKSFFILSMDKSFSKSLIGFLKVQKWKAEGMSIN